MPRVVIVGAGISGLSLAYRMQERRPDLDITLLEAGARPGGTVGTYRRDGFQVEIGPNGFLDGKPSTLNLCRAVGLGDRLIPASPEASKNRFLFLDGRLRPLPAGPGEFLMTDLLSWRGKASFLMERFRKARRAAADESIAAFARRRAGREAAQVFGDALVTGIYAGDPNLLSIRACFPRLANLEREYGSVMRGMARVRREGREATGDGRARGGKQEKESSSARLAPQPSPLNRMWSLTGGLGQIIDTLCARLQRPPLSGVPVGGLCRHDNAWIVTADGNAWTADCVVLACPAHQQCRILADLDPELANQVGAIPYNRIAVVALGYPSSAVPGALAGFGFIAPQRQQRDILGVQWCSSIFPERAPAGTVLLRAMAGGWNRADVAGWDDARLLAAVRNELRLAQGITAEPIFHHVVRWNRAIPQYLVGHLDRVAWIEQRTARYPGLFLAGNAYHGVALNDCTEQALILAENVGCFLAGRMS